MYTNTFFLQYNHVGNTIQGRQCMASALFLSSKHEEANVYFHSIKEYMVNNDSFYWNYGISLASVGLFKEGEEMLLAVQNERWREDFTYIHWLVKCHIWNLFSSIKL